MNEEERKKWLADRKKGIGGSEVAGILGVSPWVSPAEVWARKRGLIPEQPDSLRFNIGRKFEAPIAAIYAEQEKVQLVKPVELMYHPTAPIVGTPDRLIKGKPKGVEVKTADPATVHQWGEDGSDEIPIYYACQTAVYMALTDYPEWDVAVLFGTSDFRIYRLKRDLELENMILERARYFWETYVVGGVEPEPDETKAYASYVGEKYPSVIRPLLDADENQSAAIMMLFEVNEKIWELEQRQMRLQNYLKSEIGDSEGLKSSFGKITWGKVKGRTIVDWEAIAKLRLNMLTKEIREALIELHSKETQGFRRFVPYPAKGLVKE